MAICHAWVLTIVVVVAGAAPHLLVRGDGPSASALASCDPFRGRWVADKSYPLYDASTCPFVPGVFDCRRNGRPDDAYLKFRWSPANCRLPRFDGADFLRTWRGKTVMFVGDSLSMNQWVSLACMLHAAAAAAAPVRATFTSGEPVSAVRFEEYDLLLVLYHTTFLVDVVQEDIGRVLKLDSMRNAREWLGAHLLVFNTWHWWTYRGASQVWDYVQDGNSTYRDMDRLTAFSKALSTWARWVDANVDASKTRVFYQGISPSHYMSKQQESQAGTAPAGGGPGRDGMDCTHWCIAGLPDAWNHIMYAMLLQQT